MGLIGFLWPRRLTAINVSGIVVAKTIAKSAAIMVGDQNPAADEFLDTVRVSVVVSYVVESSKVTRCDPTDKSGSVNIVLT